MQVDAFFDQFQTPVLEKEVPFIVVVVGQSLFSKYKSSFQSSKTFDQII